MATVSDFFSGSTTVGSEPSATREYTVWDASDESAAVNAVNAVIPASIVGVPWRSTTVTPIANDTWRATVQYGKRQMYYRQGIDGEVPPGSVFSFDTGGGSKHITHAIKTTAANPTTGYPGTAPDYAGGIGARDDGTGVRFDGVDVIDPIYNWQQTKIWEGDDIGATYRGTLFSLTGKINASAFDGMAARSVLFRGASGTYDPNADTWSITYNFSASPNITGASVGSITGIAKGGWDYLWVTTRDEKDSNNKVVSKPEAVYVTKVYEEADFGGLGL